MQFKVLVVNSNWPSACGIIFHAKMVVDDMKLLPKVEKGSIADGVQI